VVVGRPADPESWRFERFDNLVDRLHAVDPERHPRDARTAFALDGLKLQRLLDDCAERAEELVAIAHSHPEFPAYFSATDQAAAAPFGAPSYPEATQLVVSVFGGEVREVKGFSWQEGDWVEHPLAGLPELPGAPAGAKPLEG